MSGTTLRCGLLLSTYGHTFWMSWMKVTCTNCPAEADLGPNGEDVSDTAYKLLCPVLRDRRAQMGEHDIDLDCPYMQDARELAVSRHRKGE